MVHFLVSNTSVAFASFAVLAKIVNAKAISLEDAPKGYARFDEGIAAKFVLDPHGLLPKAA